MRAAIYARYSSDLQSAASIDDQVRLCRERAAQPRLPNIRSVTCIRRSGSCGLRMTYMRGFMSKGHP